MTVLPWKIRGVLLICFCSIRMRSINLKCIHSSSILQMNCVYLGKRHVLSLKSESLLSPFAAHKLPFLPLNHANPVFLTKPPHFPNSGGLILFFLQRHLGAFPLHLPAVQCFGRNGLEQEPLTAAIGSTSGAQQGVAPQQRQVKPGGDKMFVY